MLCRYVQPSHPSTRTLPSRLLCAQVALETTVEVCKATLRIISSWLSSSGVADDVGVDYNRLCISSKSFERQTSNNTKPVPG